MSKISIDPLLYLALSVPNTDKNDMAISNNKQYYQVYTVYANTNMPATRIVCPIYMVYLGGAPSDLAA